MLEYATIRSPDEPQPAVRSNLSSAAPGRYGFAMVSGPEALRRTLSWSSVKRSLTVALVVGTALNAINHGPEVLKGDAPVVWKLILTYVVPFLVASYGSYAAFRTSIID